MNQQHEDFHSPDDEQFYQVGNSEVETADLDLEQVDQFQPETKPRSTTSAFTDLYGSSQIESHRHHEQGAPEEYDFQF